MSTVKVSSEGQSALPKGGRPATREWRAWRGALSLEQRRSRSISRSTKPRLDVPLVSGDPEIQAAHAAEGVELVWLKRR